MRFIVQVRIEPDTDSQSDVIDIAVIERDVLSPATLGLTIEEAKGLLAGVQNVVATGPLQIGGGHPYAAWPAPLTWHRGVETR